MAKLRNFRGKWYARSRWVDNGNKIEKLTPLRTSSWDAVIASRNNGRGCSRCRYIK